MIYRFDEDFDEDEKDNDKQEKPSFLQKLNPFQWLKHKKEEEDTPLSSEKETAKDN